MISKFIFMLSKSNRNALKAIEITETFKTNIRYEKMDKRALEVINDIFNARDIFRNLYPLVDQFSEYLSSLKFKDRANTLTEFSARLFIKLDNSKIGFEDATKKIQEVYRTHYKK